MSSSPLPSYHNEFVRTNPDATFLHDDASSSWIIKPYSCRLIGIAGWWNAYNKALDKNPIITKALTSFVGFFIGDLLAQSFIVQSGLDIRRLATLSSFGLIYHGPFGHFFYDWLDANIVGTDGKSVATKIFFDQVLYCPFFMIMFFTYLGIMAGDTFATIEHKIKTDLFTAVLGAWKVWPLAHIINFRFVATKHRLIFINSVQVAFNIFLSLIGSK